MCGISGIFDPYHTLSAPRLIEITRSMLGYLKSRGPDHMGYQLFEKSGTCLGHTRLAIQDPTSAGNQPMTSQCGRYTLVYNGEIYNVPQLKLALTQRKNLKLKSTCDTELLVEMISCYGISKTLPQLAGTFAFACIDHKTGDFFLARDRLGVKPLYFSYKKQKLYFASELSPLRFQEGLTFSINLSALGSYLELGYVQQPATILHGVEQLRPGHFLCIKHTGTLKETCYWDGRAQSLIRQKDLPAKTKFLHKHLHDVVGAQMICDQPLGAFLSGGINSSLIVALAQSISKKPLETFSIGFEGSPFDESAFATQIAQHLGTNHHTELLSAQKAQELLPVVSEHFDEPFADASALPTYLVSAFASKFIKVALTGAGGNALFCGYPRYVAIEKLVNQWVGQPSWAKSLLSSVLTLFTEPQINLIARYIPGLKSHQTGQKAHKIARVLEASTVQEAFAKLLKITDNAHGLLQTATPFSLANLFEENHQKDAIRWLMSVDQNSFLPCDALVSLDRTSMSHGLEARAPLLDHRIVEFSYAYPSADLVKDGVGNLPLREILKQYLPESLCDQPERNTPSIPLASWLRGPLKPWVQERLTAAELTKIPYLDLEGVQNHIKHFFDEKHTQAQSIYALAVLSNWLQKKP